MNIVKSKHQPLVISLLTSLLGSLLVSLPTSALTYQNSTDVEFTINPSINITLSDPNLIIDNLTPGSSSDSNIITVNISTNAGYGYYMSATAGTSTGNTDLTNQSSSSAKFTNLSSNVANLSSFPDNNWGYSYSTDDGSTWISGSQGSTASGYNGLPLDNDDSGATGVILASTDSFSNSGSVKFKIGAKASATQATGTYTNTVNFYAVANPEPTLGPVECEAGKICYNVNALTATEGTMGQQSTDDSSNAIVDGATVTLLASNFSREGYGFSGWSDTYDYSGNLYGPQETITVPNGTTTNGLSLYAIWMPSAGTMQANASSVCSSLTQAPTNSTKTLASVSALTDQRDGETYAIAKLADGKCWMIENLRLEANATRGDTNRLLSQGYGTSATYGNFSGLADAESTGFSTTYTANSLYYSGTQEGTASINIGTTDYPGRRMPRYNNWNNQSNSANRPQSPTANDATNSTTNAGMYSYGNYYTWHAAIADTTYYSSGDHGTTSLCPNGWRLPIGDQSTETNSFGALSVALGGPEGGAFASSSSTPTGTIMSKIFRSYPNNFLYSGNFLKSSAISRGAGGYYWSSTAYSIYTSYFLSLSISDVNPGTDYYNKNHGYSIRCTASAGS